jgi:predicted Zn-dependent peptidase
MNSIRLETLENGLRVAIERIPGMATASLCWLVPVGTAGDAPEAEGQTTLLSELILRGAGTRDSRTWSDALDALGCERRTTANPFHTLLTATMMGTRVADALPMLADCFLRPRFDPEHLDPVRRLALQALEGLSDDPQHLVMLRLAERFLPAPYNRTGYGHAEGLQGARMDALRASWSGRAVPKGSILAIAGAIDAEALLPVIGRIMEGWQGSTHEPPVTSKPLGGVDHLVQDSSQTHLAIALPAPVESDPDATALRLASLVLGGESSSRLFTEVREKRGLCYSVGASVSLGRDRGMLQVYAGSTPERAGQTLDCVCGELVRFAQGITADEFERARTGLKSRVVMQGESAAARASSVAGDLFRIGRARSLGDMAAAFDALSLKAVNEAIERHWGRSWIDRMVLASIGPAPLQRGR